jgi:adenylate kinase
MEKKDKVYEKPILVLLGAPGVGKGTFGKKLSVDYAMPIFSTGEYLRTLVGGKETSPLIEKVKKIMAEGKLLDDETIIQIIRKRLFEDEDPKNKGIIFDGFPRTIPQAEMLETVGKVKSAVNFFNKEEILIEKLTGRRECEGCHEAYNIAVIKKDGYEMEPLLPKKDQAKCDKCGGKLIHRSDDQATAIAERLKIYHEKTAPLEKFYEKKGILKSYEPKKGVTDYPWVKEEVGKILSAP